jgi:ribosomal protein L37AE/L43A
VTRCPGGCYYRRHTDGLWSCVTCRRIGTAGDLLAAAEAGQALPARVVWRRHVDQALAIVNGDS